MKKTQTTRGQRKTKPSYWPLGILLSAAHAVLSDDYNVPIA